jgi:transcriptional regulator with XRE-family HTH domain
MIILITIKEIGRRIRELRVSREMTAKKLANEIGISQSYLSDIENGKKAVPIEVLIQITEFFEISMSDFFKEEENWLEEDMRNFIYYAKLLTKEDRDLLVTLMKKITNSSHSKK